MSANAGLGTLSHLDLDSGAGLQINSMHAEPAARYLHDRVWPVFIEIFVKPAFTGVIHDTKLCGRSRKRRMCVIADRPIAHGREHHRHGKLDLRRKIADYISVFISLDLIRLFA